MDEIEPGETRQLTHLKYSPKSKRGALMRIVRDLQRFNEEQLKILIDMAHKVRRSKVQLAMVAQQAEEMMRKMPGYRDEVGIPAIEGETEEKPEFIRSGSLVED